MSFMNLDQNSESGQTFNQQSQNFPQQSVSRAHVDCAEVNKEPDENDAPLEQNVKNLECDGVPYKVVREDPPKFRKGVVSQLFFILFNDISILYVQIDTIAPSRMAARKALERTIQKESKMTRKKKKLLSEMY